MKPSLFVPALIAAAFASGCASSTALNNVRIGMTKNEIISLLGTPDSTSAQANIEYLTYYLEADSGYGRDQPYLVRLVDGKVESFGRFAQLYDLQNRPLTAANGTVPGMAPTAPVPMPAGTAVVRTAGPSGDIAMQLMRLKAMHDQGALTDEEFARAKAKVISGN